MQSESEEKWQKDYEIATSEIKNWKNKAELLTENLQRELLEFEKCKIQCSKLSIELDEAKELTHETKRKLYYAESLRAELEKQIEEMMAVAARKAAEKVIAEEQAAAVKVAEIKVETKGEEDEVIMIDDVEEQDEANTKEEDAAIEENVDLKESLSLTEEDHAFIAEVLKTKIKLSNGTESDLFSYGPPKFDSPNPTIRPVICHICRIGNLLGPDIIKSHMNGRRHLDKLKKKSINAEKFLQPYLLFYKVDGDKVKQLKIFPGEDIPEVTPEYESRIVDKYDWEFKPIENEKLIKLLSPDPLYEYNKARPILGLDYLLKMKHRDTIKVYCVLCDMYAQPNAYQHVTDAKHQATYIIKHFPNLFEKVVENLKIDDEIAKETALRNIFRKLYRKIEIKHGFKQMHLVESSDFLSYRARYINKMRRMPHYDENTLEFTETEVNVLIRKSNNNIPFNQPDLPTLAGGALPSLLAGGGGARRKRGGPVVAVEDAPVVKNRRDNETEFEKWSKYRVIMPKRLSRLASQYRRYEQDPKHHPRYQDEWSQFWHARCAQLKKDNIDPDTYNFDKEWLPFWEKRLRKLYHKDVAERKSNLRQSFGLPIGRRTPSPSNRFGNARQSIQMRSAAISGNFMPNLNGFVPNIVSNVGRGDGVGMFNRRQRLRMDQQQQQQQQEQSRNRGLGTNWRSATNRLTREPVSIISVLRLLTALEDQLGSLGPKAVQLLSKAVLCEKNNQNMNDLLTDNDYYVLFATSKEKLKGQIMANVIDNSKIRAVNIAIEDLSTILDIVEKANRSRGPIQQGGRSNGNNLYGSGNDNYGRSNTGFGGNTIGNDGGNFSSGCIGNFGNNNGGNYRANDAIDNFGLNDGGSYRNISNDGGNYRGGGGFNSNSGNYRNNSNDGGNYRGSSDSGNYRGSNDSGNYRGSNDSGNYRNNSNDDGNYRGSNTVNDVVSYRGGNNNNSGIYRGNNNDSGTNRGGNNDNLNYRSSDVGNYRNNDGGNNYSSNNNNTTSNYRNNDGGNNFSGNSFTGGFGTSNSTENQYRGSNADNFNTKSSSFGGGNSSNQRGNWMGGGGNIYTSLNSKLNPNAPAFSSDVGGGNNRPQPLMSFERNTSSNYGFASVGTRRFN